MMVAVAVALGVAGEEIMEAVVLGTAAAGMAAEAGVVEAGVAEVVAEPEEHP
jgi:hypothetical protein